MQSTTMQKTVKAGTRAGPNLRALFAINAALLGLLALVSFASTAGAQGRGRGEYTMVGGSVNGSESSAVYIVDSANQELVAITYDINTRVMTGIGYRNLAQDAGAVVRRRPGN